MLGKVTSGEADAGLVYATDAVAAGNAVDVLAVPGADRHLTSYAIALVDASTEDDLAAAWIDLLMSGEGQQVLADAGFRPAPDEGP